MKLKHLLRRLTTLALAALLVVGPLGVVAPARADGSLVLTLGADLSASQKQYILDFFNVRESEVMVINVTNQDERRLLSGQYTDAQIGTKTYSCALVNPTASGGIQVKTANLNVVTSGRIASILSTSGVTNCEVLAAAPFMVSGTGALTGVMMGYEKALDVTLDPDMQSMAIQESTTVSQIGETIGQNEATLVVNDIKIRIVRDGAKDREQVVEAVDTTIDEIEGQLADLAASSGKAAPAKLSESDHETLYDYGEKLSGMNYDYDSMKLTLQRVTTNAAKEIGIDDPIMETFEDLSAEDVLPANSILRATNDESMGENANITATDSAALDEAPVEEEPEEEAPSLDAAVAVDDLRGHRYALFEQPLTWTEASRYCNKLGGNLVSIDTLEEQQFVEELASRSGRDFSWIGGQYSSEADRWYWENGSFRFSNWDDGQPEGMSDGATYMRMANRDIALANRTAHAGKWSSAPETGYEDAPLEAMGFICELKLERGLSDADGLGPDTEAERGAKVTGVRLTKIGSVDDGYDLLGGTQLVRVESDAGMGLADLSGNLLTEANYDRISSAEHGLVDVSVAKDSYLIHGVLTQSGDVVAPCVYDDVKILNPRWVIGVKVTDSTEADYDYEDYSGNYFQISAVDVYYVMDGESTLVRTLTRQEYVRADAEEDYLNIEDRSGAVTTYDSGFNVVANDVGYTGSFDHVFPEQYSAYYDYESEHHYGVQDIDGNVVAQPFADYIYSIRDGYVEFGMENGDKSLHGLAELNGTILLPGEFDNISEVYGGPVDAEGRARYRYNCRGYYSVVQDGVNRYALEGGEITCDTGMEQYSSGSYEYCNATFAQTDDGRYTLYAADGQVTELDGYCYHMNYSAGMLWKKENRTDGGYDVMDWHGNVLLSGTYDASVSGDGYYLACKEDYRSPLDIYAVTYLYDNGQELSPAALEAQEEAPAAEPEAPAVEPEAPAAEPVEEPAVESEAPAAEPVEEPAAEPEEPAAEPEGDGESDKAQLVELLENTVESIRKADYDASREKIAQILEKEVALLEAVDAEAAGLLNLAVDYVRDERSTADLTIGIIESAIEKLR